MGFPRAATLIACAEYFSRPEHRLAGESYVGRVRVLDTAKGGRRMDAATT